MDTPTSTWLLRQSDAGLYLAQPTTARSAAAWLPAAATATPHTQGAGRWANQTAHFEENASTLRQAVGRVSARLAGASTPAHQTPVAPGENWRWRWAAEETWDHEGGAYEGAASGGIAGGGDAGPPFKQLDAMASFIVDAHLSAADEDDAAAAQRAAPCASPEETVDGALQDTQLELLKECGGCVPRVAALAAAIEGQAAAMDASVKARGAARTIEHGFVKQLLAEHRGSQSKGRDGSAGVKAADAAGPVEAVTGGEAAGTARADEPAAGIVLTGAGTAAAGGAACVGGVGGNGGSSSDGNRPKGHRHGCHQCGRGTDSVTLYACQSNVTPAAVRSRAGSADPVYVAIGQTTPVLCGTCYCTACLVIMYGMKDEAVRKLRGRIIPQCEVKEDAASKSTHRDSTHVAEGAGRSEGGEGGEVGDSNKVGEMVGTGETAWSNGSNGRNGKGPSDTSDTTAAVTTNSSNASVPLRGPGPPWRCPRCRGACCCASCAQARRDTRLEELMELGFPATGIGHNSVAVSRAGVGANLRSGSKANGRGRPPGRRGGRKGGSRPARSKAERRRIRGTAGRRQGQQEGDVDTAEDSGGDSDTAEDAAADAWPRAWPPSLARCFPEHEREGAASMRVNLETFREILRKVKTREVTKRRLVTQSMELAASKFTADIGKVVSTWKAELARADRERVRREQARLGRLRRSEQAAAKAASDEAKREKRAKRGRQGGQSRKGKKGRKGAKGAKGGASRKNKRQSTDGHGSRATKRREGLGALCKGNHDNYAAHADAEPRADLHLAAARYLRWAFVDQTVASPSDGAGIRSSLELQRERGGGSSCSAGSFPEALAAFYQDSLDHLGGGGGSASDTDGEGAGEADGEEVKSDAPAVVAVKTEVRAGVWSKAARTRELRSLMPFVPAGDDDQSGSSCSDTEEG